MLPQIPTAIENALSLAEAVDEPWLYRQVAHALMTEDTVTGNEVHPQWNVPNYVIKDQDEFAAWVQSDTYVAVEDCR